MSFVMPSVAHLPPGLGGLVESFDLHLAGANKSPNTRRIYVGTVVLFAGWLAEHAAEITEWDQVRRRHVQSWIVDRLEDWSEGDANNKFRALQQFCRWAHEIEDEMPANPMAGLRPPSVTEVLFPIIEQADLARLFKSMSASKADADRRDYALIRLFGATGVRLEEMAKLGRDNLDLHARKATVLGKGSRWRTVRFDAATAVALDRYIRVRGRDPRYAGHGRLWLGEKGRGPMTGSGIRQMLERRGEALTPPMDLWPHRFRHTFAHRFLENGGAEGDLMELMGWKSMAMVRRYAASTRARRAQTSYDRVNPLDGL